MKILPRPNTNLTISHLSWAKIIGCCLLCACKDPCVYIACFFLFDGNGDAKCSTLTVYHKFITWIYSPATITHCLFLDFSVKSKGSFWVNCRSGFTDLNSHLWAVGKNVFYWALLFIEKCTLKLFPTVNFHTLKGDSFHQSAATIAGKKPTLKHIRWNWCTFL